MKTTCLAMLMGLSAIAVDRFTTGHLKDLPPAKDGSDNLLGWLGRIHGLAVDANQSEMMKSSAKLPSGS